MDSSKKVAIVTGSNTGIGSLVTSFWPRAPMLSGHSLNFFITLNSLNSEVADCLTAGGNNIRMYVLGKFNVGLKCLKLCTLDSLSPFWPMFSREAALLLAKDGMKVFLACRNVDRAQDAASYIRESCPGADVEIMLLDLESLKSVQKCASDFKTRNLSLNLLINNAGMNLKTERYTADGVGACAQVNYLGPYVFTRLLEEPLVAGAPSRVVNVSSVTHRHGTMPDPEKFLRNFHSGHYPRTKLANVLFSFELQRRWQGKGVQTCAVDPGAVLSDIWRKTRFEKPPFSWVLKTTFAPTWDGATAVYHAATTPLENTQDKTPLRFFARGAFSWWGVTKLAPNAFLQLCCSFVDWPVRNLSRGLLLNKTVEVPANPLAYEEELASKLWNISAVTAGLPA